MSESLSDYFLFLLTFSPVSRLRRNHGLEHATLHVLQQRNPQRSMAGHSDLSGFWIIGNIEAEEIQTATAEALRRLRSGEHSLAVHPNCGTNIATAAVLAGSVSALSMFGAGRRFRDKLERLPLAITLATLALIAAQPLGYLLQERLTTSGEPEALEIVEIIPTMRGRFKVYRIVTVG